MHRSHRIRLDPTNKQRTQLQRSAGVARFAYNWALATWQEEYCLHCEDQDHPTPNQYSLRKQLNDIKKQDYPWMLEVNKCAPQEAIINLGKAFTSFFNKRSGYPRYKKRGVHDSFQVTGDRLRVKDKAIYISRIGWIRMTEPLRFSDAKMINVTISKTANHWYASILVEIPEITTQPKTATSSIVGVDLGVKDLATLSIGEKIPATNSHKRSLKRLRRLNQELHRRQTGSNNQRKAKIRLARAHARVASQRNDTLHKLSHRLINDFDVVAIEDLNVAGMVKNHKLTRSISDASFGELRRQLEYKAAETGTHLVVVDRFYPSSKTCSACGTKTKSLTLSQRSWKCDPCGCIHDRDINAALNLAQWARTNLSTAGGSSVAACGDDVRPGGQANVCEAGTRQLVTA